MFVDLGEVVWMVLEGHECSSALPNERAAWGVGCGVRD
jgi:hypothetical protein